jgi:hypothetical protein
MDEIVYTSAALLAVILPWFGFFAAYKLQKLSRSPRGKGIEALRERANTAVLLAIASAFGGLLGLNRFFDLSGEPLIRGAAAVLVIATVIILTSIPGLYWTFKYARQGFVDDDISTV